MNPLKNIKTKSQLILYFIFLLLFIVSCENEHPQVMENKPISGDVITKLQQAGFDTSEGLQKYKNGYLVEYDIFLTEEQIDALANFSTSKSSSPDGRVEHYRTNYILGNLPGTLKIYMDPTFGTYMQNAFDAALARYNNEGLAVKFVRTTNSSIASIRINAFFEQSNVLGYSAGFPNSGGAPASPISLNTLYYSNATARPDATTVIAHEIGHAIGFRHTDYMDRTFSCGASDPNPNEGSAGVGAINIGGTPTTPVANSWMLACSNNTDRPFTAEDKTALSSLFACSIYIPQITSEYMDGVKFQSNVGIRTGFHTLTIQASNNGATSFSPMSGNISISSQSNGTCSFNIGAGGGAIKVTLVNDCYNRFEIVGIYQIP